MIDDEKSKNQKNDFINNKNKSVRFSDFVAPLSIIGIVGLVIRFYYFPYDIPFTYDALDYFSYAMSMSQTGQFPNNWVLVNNGWPSLVSFFFMNLNSENFIDYVHTQRILSIIISVLTIIPIYLIAKKFFDKTWSIIATALFVFNPKIIENSLLGVTESLYLFLITIGLFLLLSKNSLHAYISFIIIALVSIIRYEGLLLLIPFSIIFFIKFKNEKKIIFKYILALLLFLLIIIPVGALRMESSGQDGFISHYTAGLIYVSDDLVEGTEEDEEWIIEGQNNIPIFLKNGIYGFIKALGLLLIPFSIFLIPASLIIIFTKKYQKKIDLKVSSIILLTGIMCIPAFYAFGRNIDDPRFIFVFLPFLCILSIPILKDIQEKINKKRIFSICFIGVIIIGGTMIMEYQKTDYENEREVYQIIKYVIENTDGVNAISPESRYFKTAEIEHKWPNISNLEVSDSGHVSREINRIFAEDFKTLNELLIESKKIGITHLIVDGKDSRPDFLNSIYQNDENYPFLERIYDSTEHGLEYHVKIYLINYEHFEEIQNYR
tara:strand:+ start:2813 stop:4456 length:1644 start_codon:yes stop_codon:yes gene_type:complete